MSSCNWFLYCFILKNDCEGNGTADSLVFPIRTSQCTVKQGTETNLVYLEQGMCTEMLISGTEMFAEANFHFMGSLF